MVSEKTCIVCPCSSLTELTLWLIFQKSGAKGLKVIASMSCVTFFAATADDCVDTRAKCRQTTITNFQLFFSTAACTCPFCLLSCGIFPSCLSFHWKNVLLTKPEAAVAGRDLLVREIQNGPDLVMARIQKQERRWDRATHGWWVTGRSLKDTQGEIKISKSHPKWHVM